jgi:hypothetical protein
VVSALLCENSAGFQETISMMIKRILTVSLCLLALTLCSFAQTKKSPMKKSAGPAPDKALMQKIWDGWSTLDPANVAQYYATGPHVFFDIEPLKYASWDEYEKGVKGVLAGYQSGKCTVNDDAEIHPHGDLVWGHGHHQGTTNSQERKSRDGQLPVDRNLGERRREVADRPRTCFAADSVRAFATDFTDEPETISPRGTQRRT